jgi:SAM-dependent methyltransferase
MHPSPSKIIDLASAFYRSSVLFAASDLGVFARLSSLQTAGGATLANELGLNPRGLNLLLDACVAIGLLEKTNGNYRNTPESEAFLVPGKPGNLSEAIRYNRDVYPVWSHLADFVRRGDPGELPELHLGANVDRTRTFVLSMHGKALAMGPAVIPLLELNGKKKLLDVGGGPGTYSALIAKRNPGIRCTILDLPAVVEIAGELIAQQGLSANVVTMAGDYHTAPFPRENDVVNFFGVLHQESPETIQDLFVRAFESLRPGGAVYVMDMMTDATHTAPEFSALFAVNMALTAKHGWVFSDAELKGWLEKAGFRDFSVKKLPPPIPHWLAYARKPD